MEKLKNREELSASGIAYPVGKCSEWYGFRRHDFLLEGHAGFIVEPSSPAPGLPWSWCPQWAEAFVPRTPALQLLKRGFHHVFLDLFDTRMNPEGIAIAEKFYKLLQSLHFHPKMALIGMSYGGLFSFRWAAEHPETVGAIYADAPVCDLAFACGRDETNALPCDLENMRADARRNAAAYSTTEEELRNHPLSPLQNYLPIAAAHIPILAIRNGQDRTVIPEQNIDLLAERLKAAGGQIEILDRKFYGHHPHGLDDPSPLTEFILRYYP